MLRLRSSLITLATILVAPVAVGAPSKTPETARPPAHHATHAQGGRTAKLERASHHPTPGRSVGSPTEGHLLGGAHVDEGPYIRVVPSYAAGDARWGLEPLVQMIDHSAHLIHKQFPDAVLSVGHLSRPGGGEIDRHASHESGRDADIGFYVRNQHGKSIYADHFVAFKGDGTAPTWPGAAFDDAKNWAFVAAISGDAHARVSHIFVASPLRARLLQYAEKVGAPPAIRTRASELMAQPKGSLPHDDHFHVRISCPPGMDQCIEQPLARKHSHGSAKAALASAHGATPHGGNGNGNGNAKSHTPAPTHGAQPAKPAAAAPAADESENKSEALVPSLAPMIPGLDAAVIPAPLAGAQPAKPAEHPTPVAPVAAEAPIDDPDGVLDPSR